MAERRYWFVPFDGDSWQAFGAAGGRELAFAGTSARRSADVRPGDYLLCGLMGISRFVGILRVVDLDRRKLSGDPRALRCRLGVKPLIVLTPQTGLPAVELRDRLGCFHASPQPHAWMRCFWRAFIQWKAEDGERVVSALLKIRQHPLKRPFAAGVLAPRPQACEVAGRLLTAAGGDGAGGAEVPPGAASGIGAQAGRRTLVQAFFLKLGRLLGFDCWIPAPARRRKMGGRPLGRWPGVRSALQLPLEGPAHSALEAMDVLWLQGEKAVAAFAVAEKGFLQAALLNVADFLSLSPDTCIALYLAAPGRRRPEVIRRINRAAFAALELPPARACRFIPFNSVYRTVPRLKSTMPPVTPAVLLEISESCEPAEGP